MDFFNSLLDRAKGKNGRQVVIGYDMYEQTFSGGILRSGLGSPVYIINVIAGRM